MDIWGSIVITHVAFLSNERVRVKTSSLDIRHKKRDFAVEPILEVLFVRSNLLEEVVSSRSQASGCTVVQKKEYPDIT